MDMWVTEYQTPALGFSCKITETLRVEQTDFQHLAIVNTEQFGRMMLLDGMVMTTDADEFVYHEMISMVAVNAHPAPRNVLIIGGGDGGALREVARHPEVQRAVLVEIDGRVIQASKDFFPNLACAFDNPKSEIIVADGIEYIKTHQNEFDVILVDSTEPVGPAVELFSTGFYQACRDALKEDGMLVVQSESPFINTGVIKMAFAGVKEVFPLTKLYLANVPTYPSGLWSFAVGSKKYDPESPVRSYGTGLKYYNEDVHKAAFKLPNFVRETIGI